MAYATVSDYELRHGAVDASEEPMVAALLEDAATMLDSLVPCIDISDQHQREVLCIVSCSMVSRTMSASSASVGDVDQMSYVMGPFQQTAHFANPSGDMYLTAGERRLLGISVTVIGTVPARVHRGRWC